MPYENLQIPGLDKPTLSWANHQLSQDEQNMLRNTSRLPCVFHHVSLMPDAHLGIGAMVGSVVATKNAVVPSICGVDIGCGMSAIKTGIHSSELDNKLPELYENIMKRIPVGFSEYSRSDLVKREWDGFNNFKNLHSGVQDRKQKALNQLGTLGGGNHFIELCVNVPDENEVWLVLHSGSRGIGNQLAQRHIATAKLLWRLAELPDPNLAYFIQGTPEFQAYWHDLQWAQEYAFQNREVMVRRLLGLLSKTFGRAFTPEIRINCHHNYVAMEHHYGENVYVTRKGAIRAQAGDMGIIPGSMGTHTFIVKGLGNAESFNSASHGAGRVLSRGAAKRKYTVEDLEAQTEGIICPKDKSKLDEIPASYKNIFEVMKNQSDLVEIVAELRQVLNVKG